ncbi:PorV/PorQ family protein [Roseivirga echinicomitans]|uniref:hypothetical protein n=1 Tax=Roseivirga echinicomitans TaxID=296218 RepID=UPI0012FDDE45|nr:hypothetical protein [Roseivirga echinicomitans]
MKIIYAILIIFYLSLKVSAQQASRAPIGPRALSMGGVSSVFHDSWSIFNNPAGVTDIKQLTALLAYKTIFDFIPFNTVSAGVAMPTGIGSFSFSVFRFGDDVFNSQMASLSIAQKTGIIRLGLKLNYLQYNIEGFGSKSTLLSDIGVVADLTPQLRFGAHIYNFTQSSISADNREKVPTVISLGMAYSPKEDIVLAIEGEKDIDLEPDLKLGLEYQAIEKVKVRTGFSTLTNTHSFGGGLQLNRFGLDYGIRIDRKLGHTHNFGLTFQINE